MLGGDRAGRAGVGLGALLSAVQLLPFVHQLGETFLGDRTQTTESFETLGSLVTMLVPDAYGTAAEAGTVRATRSSRSRTPASRSWCSRSLGVLAALVGRGAPAAAVGRRGAARDARWSGASRCTSVARVLVALQELPVLRHRTGSAGPARCSGCWSRCSPRSASTHSSGACPGATSTTTSSRVVVARRRVRRRGGGRRRPDAPRPRHRAGAGRRRGLPRAGFRSWSGCSSSAAVAVVVARWGTGCWRLAGLVVAARARDLAGPDVRRCRSGRRSPRDAVLPADRDARVPGRGARPRPVRVDRGRDAARHERDVRPAHAQRPRVHADRVRRPAPGRSTRTGSSPPTLVEPILPAVRRGRAPARPARRPLHRRAARGGGGRRPLRRRGTGSVRWRGSRGRRDRCRSRPGPFRGIGVEPDRADHRAPGRCDLDVRVLDQAGDEVASGGRLDPGRAPGR